jgi:hypothetical protein
VETPHEDEYSHRQCRLSGALAYCHDRFVLSGILARYAERVDRTMMDILTKIVTAVGISDVP